MQWEEAMADLRILSINMIRLLIPGLLLYYIMQSPRAEFGLGVANNAMFAVGNYNGTQDDGERIL